MSKNTPINHTSQNKPATEVRLTGVLLVLLAIIGALTLSNLYFIQALLNLIVEELHLTDFESNLIALLSQAGYTLGLLFVVPLGDFMRVRRLISILFCILIPTLVVMGLSQSLFPALACALVMGICCVCPQIFVPFISRYSSPENRDSNISIVLSAMLLGIPLGRVMAGIAGEYMGWRSIYFIGAALMIPSLWAVTHFVPDNDSGYDSNYRQLMRSIPSLFMRHATLRICAIRGAFAFASFFALWNCLAFKLAGPPFFADNTVIGLVGLSDIAATAGTLTIGRKVKTIGYQRLGLWGNLLILTAWITGFVLGEKLWGLVAALMLISIGTQFTQIANQNEALSIDKAASARLNTAFMTVFFIGGLLGTLTGATSWSLMGWNGVVVGGCALGLASLVMTVMSKKK